MASNGERPIELSELVRQLRAELKAAAAEGAEAGETLQFDVGPVEIEATVAATREAGGSGKVRFWVVDAGGDSRFTRSETQRITLTLNPKTVRPDGSAHSPRISGPAVDGER
ncbi:trypco2 family protein [Streptomyces winkii]|uniref:trypco2 family protein n=1 Tax=Streptomyces winkii TaxID=3051178 RepID=UPI0028CFE046|nr:trypco2 family protein [Streptomyces sp. DSM 40971]